MTKFTTNKKKIKKFKQIKKKKRERASLVAQW